MWTVILENWLAYLSGIGIYFESYDCLVGQVTLWLNITFKNWCQINWFYCIYEMQIKLCYSNALSSGH